MHSGIWFDSSSTWNNEITRIKCIQSCVCTYAHVIFNYTMFWLWTDSPIVHVPLVKMWPDPSCRYQPEIYSMYNRDIQENSYCDYTNLIIICGNSNSSLYSLLLSHIIYIRNILLLTWIMNSEKYTQYSIFIYL